MALSPDQLGRPVTSQASRVGVYHRPWREHFFFFLPPKCSSGGVEYGCVGGGEGVWGMGVGGMYMWVWEVIFALLF